MSRSLKHDLLSQKIEWHYDPEKSLDFFIAEVNGQEYKLVIGDFPDEAPYSLYVGEVRLCSFDDWPEPWVRP